jgi:hypothetical protein
MQRQHALLTVGILDPLPQFDPPMGHRLWFRDKQEKPAEA